MVTQAKSLNSDSRSGMSGGVGTHTRETLLEFEKRGFEISIAEKRSRDGHANTAGKHDKRVYQSELTERHSNRINGQRIEQIHPVAQHTDPGNRTQLQDGSEPVVFTNHAGTNERGRGQRCGDLGWMLWNQADRQGRESGGRPPLPPAAWGRPPADARPTHGPLPRRPP